MSQVKNEIVVNGFLDLKIKENGPIKVRDEMREKWSGFLPIYRFFCPKCKSFQEDYPHGYEDRLNCQNDEASCKYALYMKPKPFF